MRSLKELQCKDCGKWFVAAHKRRYCHSPCGNKPNGNTCRNCGTWFKGVGRGPKRFCICKCARDASQRLAEEKALAKAVRKARAKGKRLKPCPVCSTMFDAKYGSRVTCSKECGVIQSAKLHTKDRIAAECTQCGKKFMREPYKKTYERVFCSLQCTGEYKKHHNKTEAYKTKWAESDYARQLEAQAESRARRREHEEKARWRCCSWCGKAKRGLSKWCSGGECSRERNAAARKDSYECDSGTVECVRCGKKRWFETHASRRRYCSRRCLNRSSNKENDAKRQARIKRSASMVRPMSLERLFKRDKRTCQICGCKCVVPTGLNLDNEGTKDHIIPLVEGGLDDARNTRLACRTCNTRKGAAIEPGSQMLLPLA